MTLGLCFIFVRAVQIQEVKDYVEKDIDKGERKQTVSQETKQLLHRVRGVASVREYSVPLLFGTSEVSLFRAHFKMCVFTD